jgi:tetratricopeptide (TPR) repeat protein
MNMDTQPVARRRRDRGIPRSPKAFLIPRGVVPAAWLVALFLSGGWIGAAHAQNDTIKRAAGRDIRCHVIRATKTSVAYELSGQNQEISAAEVQYVDFAGEPTELGRARTRLASGQFADCLTELQKIDPGPLSALIKAEISHLTATAEARRAMIDGTTTARDAARIVSQALKDYPESYHYFDLADQLGLLAFHAGELASAEAQFQEMVNSGVPPFALRGHLRLGRVLIEQNKLPEAKDHLDQVIRSDATDDFAQDAKLIARCLSARVMAGSSQAPQAIELLQSIISSESSERKQVFAYCYNSLGICHLGAADLKNATLAFLHTDLLYSSESDLHAEALFYLSDIWSKLGRTDDALRAKQTLSQQYRNSFWASKK